MSNRVSTEDRWPFSGIPTLYLTKLSMLTQPGHSSEVPRVSLIKMSMPSDSCCCHWGRKSEFFVTVYPVNLSGLLACWPSWLEELTVNVAFKLANLWCMVVLCHIIAGFCRRHTQVNLYRAERSTMKSNLRHVFAYISSWRLGRFG